MSMWEIEALAEMAVGIVAQADWPLTDKRDAYASIFSMTNQFDVGFTHFRSLGPLTEAGFLMRVDFEQHPDYAARQGEFEALRAGRSTWLKDEDGAYEALYEPKARGAQAAGIWFDATMPFWQRAVDAGLLEGLAAEPVQVWPAKEAIVKLMTLADRDPDKSGRMLKVLHGFAVMLFMVGTDAGDETLAEALALPNLPRALATEGEDDAWVDERFDARMSLRWADDPKSEAFIEWWCGPYGA